MATTLTMEEWHEALQSYLMERVRTQYEQVPEKADRGGVRNILNQAFEAASHCDVNEVQRLLWYASDTTARELRWLDGEG